MWISSSPLQAAKVLFTTKTIEEHERKSDKGWKAVGWNECTEAVLKFGWKKPKKHVSAGAELLAAALDRCLAFGICKPSYNWG